METVELTSNLLAIQTVLKNAEKSAGDFIKMKHKGGCEMKMSSLIKELKNCLIQQNCYDENKIDVESEELDKIAMFFILKTEYSENISSLFINNTHLTSLAPTISTCLLLNIIVELNLLKSFCKVIDKFPINTMTALYHELFLVLKKTPTSQSMEYCFMSSKESIKKLNNVKCTSITEREECDKLAEVTTELIQLMSKLTAEDLPSWKKLKLYTHMGYIGLYSLTLLDICDLQESSYIFQSSMLNALMSATIELFRSVTITIYCVWAEIELNDEPMQICLAEKAYYVMEKLAHIREAKELLNILKSMAKPPKTLEEKINMADISKIVLHINKADANQLMWFRALFKFKIFHEPKALKCLNKWSHLCTTEDVKQLLSLAAPLRSGDINNHIIKCAAHFDSDTLLELILQYHSNNNFKNSFETDTFKEQVKLLLNKIHAESEDFTKDLLIMCLQNTPYLFSQLYGECIKSLLFTNCLESFFKTTQYLAMLNNLGLNSMSSLIKECKPNDNNIAHYKKLIALLLSLNVFSQENLLLKLFYPVLLESYKTKNYDDVNAILVLVNSVCDRFDYNIEVVVKLLLEILDTNRVKFFDFTYTRQEANENIIKYLNSISTNKLSKQYKNTNAVNKLNRFYVQRLQGRNISSLYEYIAPDVNSDDHYEMVAKYIKILQSAVTVEWIDLFSNMRSNEGTIKTINLLTDILIVYSTFATNQEHTNLKNFVTAGLKYCLKNYGILIKDHIYPKCSDTNEQMTVINQVCYLISQIPDSIREKEGLKLLSLFEENTLKLFKNDVKFVTGLAAINNEKISMYLNTKSLE